MASLRARIHEHRLAEGKDVPWWGVRGGERSSSEGIVMAAGGRYLPLGIAAIRQLARVGCDLPVLVVHSGAEEMPEGARARLLELGADVVDAASALRAPPDELRGWQLKAVAVALSPFRHTLLIDADVIFLRDPARAVFRDTSYVRTGAVFWPDIVAHGDQYGRNLLLPEFWDALGLPSKLRPGPDALQQEASCVAVDKVRHERPLRLALALNLAHRDTYALAFGDKDTWHASFRACAAPFSWCGVRPGSVGMPLRAAEGTALKDMHFLQYAPGTPALDGGSAAATLVRGVPKHAVVAPAGQRDCANSALYVQGSAAKAGVPEGSVWVPASQWIPVGALTMTVRPDARWGWSVPDEWRPLFAQHRDDTARERRLLGEGSVTEDSLHGRGENKRP